MQFPVNPVPAAGSGAVAKAQPHSWALDLFKQEPRGSFTLAMFAFGGGQAAPLCLREMSEIELEMGEYFSFLLFLSCLIPAWGFLS